MSSFVVVLDACTIFPMSLRDILLRAADVGLYRLVLTETYWKKLEETLLVREV